MALEVLLTHAAERDLEEIYRYIAEHETPRRADELLDRLVAVTDALSTFPDRGVQPKELRDLGIHEFRQVSFRPYRVIYRVQDGKVIVYLIADGRRDMQSLLLRRLLG
jgi:toxin ParE1/3/4